MANILSGEIGIETRLGAYLLRPSLFNMSKLDDPDQITGIPDILSKGDYTSLMCAQGIIYKCLKDCPDSDKDLNELLGVWVDENGSLDWIEGDMSVSETIIIASALLKNGIAGAPKVKIGKGKVVAEWDASEFVGAAVAHLGLSIAESWNLTMIEFQRAIESKFPDLAADNDKYPTAEEHSALISAAEKTMH